MRNFIQINFCFLFLVFCSLTEAQPIWTKRNPQPGSLTIYDFHNPSPGAVIGFTYTKDNAVTINSGNYWSYQRPAVPIKSYVDLKFSTNKIGFASTPNDTLLKTTDGGFSWKSVGNRLIEVFEFSDTLNGIARVWDNQANLGAMVKTTDGGQTWIQTLANAPYYYGLKHRTDQEYWSVITDNSQVTPSAKKLHKTTNSGSTWTSIDIGSTKPISEVYFFDENLGWATSDSGFLAKTTNGGVTWTSQYLDLPSALFPEAFKKIKFLNPDIGWVICGLQLYKTTDGGSSWQNITYQSGYYVNAFTFITIDEGWCSGAYGAIFHTTDGGASWQSQVKGLNEIIMSGDMQGYRAWVLPINGPNLYFSDNKGVTWNKGPELPVNSSSYQGVDMEFVDNQVGYVGADNVYKTTNGGQSWSLSSNDLSTLSDIDFVSRDTGFAASLLGNLARTYDGGVTWQKIIDNPMAEPLGSAHKICFPTGKIGFRAIAYSIGSNNIFYNGSVSKTTDGGNNWTNFNFETTNIYSISSMFFLDSLRGWVIYGAGLSTNSIQTFQAKTIDGGQTWEKQTSPFFGKMFSL